MATSIKRETCLKRPVFKFPIVKSKYIFTCIKQAPALNKHFSVIPWVLAVSSCFLKDSLLFGPRQANLVLIAYASSEGSGEPAHPRSLARTSATRSYKHWVKRNLQIDSQIPRPSEWLGMRSQNLSWRNARRHKFAWHGPFEIKCLKSIHLDQSMLFAQTCLSKKLGSLQ